MINRHIVETVTLVNSKGQKIVCNECDAEKYKDFKLEGEKPKKEAPKKKKAKKDEV